MLSLTKIREDLKEIRYYYSRKAMFDQAAQLIPPNMILAKIKKYNDAIKFAPARLYDMFYSLYVKNYTQEALSIELSYVQECIHRQNKLLLLFLQSKITD